MSDNIANVTNLKSFNQENLKILEMRLTKIENNLSKIQSLEQRLTKIESNLSETEDLLSRLSGEEYYYFLEEIMTALPFNSIDDVMAAEEKLANPEYAQAMEAYIYNLKDVSKDLVAIIPKIFSDEVLDLFSWDGKFDKRSLAKLIIIKTILSEAFKSIGHSAFEKDIQTAIQLSRNRIEQNRFNCENAKSITGLGINAVVPPNTADDTTNAGDVLLDTLQSGVRVEIYNEGVTT